MVRLGLATALVVAAITVMLVGGEAPPAAAAFDIDLSASDDELPCGGQIVITAEVTEDGSPVPDGTVITFTIGGVVVATEETEDGEASIVINAPAGSVGPVVISASLGAVSDSLVISVTCVVAGPPASLALLITPGSITCGSQASVLATVRDQLGRFVANGTAVNFVASGNGSIVPTAPTINGVATSVFTATPGTSGIVQISATVAGTTITASGAVQVTCATPPTPTAPPPAPTAAPPAVVPSTGIRPPSTGDGGLR